MTPEELRMLKHLLQKFLEEQDTSGSACIKNASSLESAAIRENYISGQLEHIKAVLRWVSAKTYIFPC